MYFCLTLIFLNVRCRNRDLLFIAPDKNYCPVLSGAFSWKKINFAPDTGKKAPDCPVPRQGRIIIQTKSITNTHVYSIENERRKKEEKHHILYVLINKICTWYFFQTKNKKKTLHCTMAPKGQILFFVKLSLFIFKLSLF